ncbi:MAG: PilN domain-containing protein [Pyrinomonadaceae bacterium]
MIKVNLLESVTDRTLAASVVEKKVLNPRTQMLLLALVVASLAVLGMGYDYLSSHAQRDTAQKELDRQQQIAAQMAAVNKEQADLEKKTKDIQARIDAIHRLRTSQQGPSAVLAAIKQRFDGAPDLYFESVEQKGNDLVIKGGSPNEASVTRFGQSLEFSSGLFSNLSIETERKAVASVTAPTATAAGAALADAPPVEVVNFTIKCSYQPSNPAPQSSAPGVAVNQVAQK